MIRHGTMCSMLKWAGTRHKKETWVYHLPWVSSTGYEISPFFCQDLLPVAHKSLRIAFTPATLKDIASVVRPVCKSRTLASLMSRSWSIKSLLICYRGGGRDSWPGMWDLLRHIKPLHRSHLLDGKYTLGINRRSGCVREGGGLKTMQALHVLAGDALETHGQGCKQGAWISAFQLEATEQRLIEACSLWDACISFPRIHHESERFPSLLFLNII